MKNAFLGLLTIALGACLLSAAQVETLQPQNAPGRRLFRSASTNGIVLVSEGSGEAASIGSYSLRLMEADGLGEPADLKAGVLLPRDGSIVKVWRGNLRGLGPDEVAVWLQSAGSGSAGLLQLFTIGKTNFVEVALPSPSAGVKGYMGHDRFEIDAKGIRWSCPLYGKHLELSIATNQGALPLKYPAVRVAGDSNAEPRGGEARARYDAQGNKWIRD